MKLLLKLQFILYENIISHITLPIFLSFLIIEGHLLHSYLKGRKLSSLIIEEGIKSPQTSLILEEYL